MKKRVVAILMATVVAVGSLAGCGSKGGLPAFGGRLCGGGAGCRKNRLESLAACRIRKTFIRGVR